MGKCVNCQIESESEVTCHVVNGYCMETEQYEFGMKQWYCIRCKTSWTEKATTSMRSMDYHNPLAGMGKICCMCAQNAIVMKYVGENVYCGACHKKYFASREESKSKDPPFLMQSLEGM